MAIEKIDDIKCSGCKVCVDACPMDVIRFDEGKNVAYIAYPEDCDFCLACEEACPLDCIYVYPSRLGKLPMPH
ncbi:ferredoxin family protein [Chloroflexota bacterium]